MPSPLNPGLNYFDSFDLEFTTGGNTTTVTRNSSNVTSSVQLDVGTYNLVVKAYKGTSPRVLVAQGTASQVNPPSTDIVISAGGTTNGTVTLTLDLAKMLVEGNGNGTFIWNVNLSSITGTLNTATMTITERGQTIPIEAPINLLIAGNLSNNRSLESGMYNVRFNLEKSDGNKVVWNELLHVYWGLESRFANKNDNTLPFTFTDAHFSGAYTVTINYNDGDDDPTVPVSVLHGDTIDEPVTARTGHTLDGWLDNATGLPFNFGNPIYNNITLNAKWLININTAAITGITTPVTGETPVTTATAAATGIVSSNVAVEWSPTVASGGNFQGSTEYTAYVTLTANASYTFPATGFSATINGETATVTGAPGNTVTVSYEFDATEVAVSVSVGTQNGKLIAGMTGSTVTFPVTTIEIANGTYTATVANLPTGVTVQGNVTVNANSGILTLAGNNLTVASTANNLTLTIDGVTSNNFSLSIITDPNAGRNGTAGSPWQVYDERTLRMVGRGAANPAGYTGWTLTAN